MGSTDPDALAKAVREMPHSDREHICGMPATEIAWLEGVALELMEQTSPKKRLCASRTGQAILKALRLAYARGRKSMTAVKGATT